MLLVEWRRIKQDNRQSSLVSKKVEAWSTPRRSTSWDLEIAREEGIHWTNFKGEIVMESIGRFTLEARKLLAKKDGPQKKLKIEYDPAISLLGIYPKWLLARIWKDICIPRFIEALFTIAKKLEQSKSPSMNGWISKIWYIHTTEYYLALKRK